MPGIVGLVQSSGTDVAETVAASARKLQHLDTLTMLSGTFDGVGLAQVWRDQARPDRDWVDESDFAVRIAGHVLEDGSRPRRLVARDIAENCAPVSVALTKRMIWEHLGGPPPVEVAKREAKALWALGRSADAREGVQSFLEKRKPRFTLSPTSDAPELDPID